MNIIRRTLDKLKHKRIPLKANRYFHNTHLKEVFYNTPIGMVLLDKNNRILIANQQAVTIFTSAQSNAAGRIRENVPLQTLIQTEARNRFVKQFSAITENMQTSFKADFPLSAENIENYETENPWITMYCSRANTFRKHPVFFALIEDITENRKSKKNLRKAKEEAEHATRIKSEFLANMSHEIRTPIHTITGMTELISETGLDAEQKDYAEQIQFSAEVLLHLVNDILDFTKIESGRLNLEIADMDLYQVVENALDLVSLEAHRKGLELIMNIKKDVPGTLKGDSVRLREILVNLLSNAVKFTNEGEIEIIVKQKYSTKTYEELEFSVRDTGIGMDKYEKRNIFSPFSQADSSTSRKYGGTGLGLTISRNLIRLMSGTIDVESAPAKGSVFRFTARFEKPKKTPKPVSTTTSFSAESTLSGKTSSVDTGVFEGLKILVIDDNDTARKALTELLSDWGSRVTEAISGFDALDKMRKAASKGTLYDLCLIDQDMPEIDGWHLASEINNDKSINSAKLILCAPAGTSTAESKMKLLRWFDDYINKPVKPRSLSETINNVIHSDLDLEEVSSYTEPAEEPITIPEHAKVLVAEDHEVNQQLFCTILDKIGYTVDTAENGMEAIKMALNREYDIIFMDIQMPEVNGVQATRKLRERGITIPIIAVTAHALREEMEKSYRAGMNDYLTKPFKKKDLLPVLSKWLLQGTETENTAESLRPSPGPQKSKPEPITKNKTPAAGGNLEKSDSKEELFSLERALESFLGKKDMVMDILAKFEVKVEGQLKDIDNALKTDNLDEVREQAHSIKGSAWNLEAKKLGDKAAELEYAARDGKKENAVYHADELKNTFEKFKAYIAEIEK